MPTTSFRVVALSTHRHKATSAQPFAHAREITSSIEPSTATNQPGNPMPSDDMNFKLADRVDKVVRRHVARGTPADLAWPDIIRAARPGLGPDLAKAALKLPISDGLATCVAEYASLLLRDNAGPAKKVNGLWFGLAELAQSRKQRDTVWTPYISGSTRFSAKHNDWPCDPAWFPDDRWAPNAPMTALSRLRAKHPRRRWTIEVSLIAPLHTLYVAQFARAAPAGIILGRAKSRGIGAGFDDGDLLTLGIVSTKGFIPVK